MGEDGDGNPLHPFVEAAVAEGGAGVRYFNAHSAGGLGNPVLRPVIEQVGTTAKSMLRRRSSDGSAARRPLLPGPPGPEAAGVEGIAPRRQRPDLVPPGLHHLRRRPDRRHDVLDPARGVRPEAGTMSFVDGSHRLGVMGDYTTYGDGDALTAFPELQDLEMSPPMHYELGDITVHTHLTVHGASENRTERPRWAWLVIVQPEDICWNGSPCPNFDHRAMKPWQPMQGDRFPVIS